MKFNKFLLAAIAGAGLLVSGCSQVADIGGDSVEASSRAVGPVETVQADTGKFAWFGRYFWNQRIVFH
jgi:outer membrane murein-binding lipoprotein Lpp